MFVPSSWANRRSIRVPSRRGSRRERFHRRRRTQNSRNLGANRRPGRVRRRFGREYRRTGRRQRNPSEAHGDRHPRRKRNCPLGVGAFHTMPRRFETPCLEDSDFPWHNSRSPDNTYIVGLRFSHDVRRRRGSPPSLAAGRIAKIALHRASDLDRRNGTFPRAQGRRSRTRRRWLARRHRYGRPYSNAPSFPFRRRLSARSKRHPRRRLDRTTSAKTPRRLAQTRIARMTERAVFPRI